MQPSMSNRSVLSPDCTGLLAPVFLSFDINCDTIYRPTHQSFSDKMKLMLENEKVQLYLGVSFIDKDESTIGVKIQTEKNFIILLLGILFYENAYIVSHLYLHLSYHSSKDN